MLQEIAQRLGLKISREKEKRGVIIHFPEEDMKIVVSEKKALKLLLYMMKLYEKNKEG